jgi:hypothetical protein
MSDRLGFVIALYAVFLAGLAGWTGIRGREFSPVLIVGLGFLELMLLVQALVEVVGMARGRVPDEAATHIGYLITSIAILPFSVGPTLRRAVQSPDDPGMDGMLTQARSDAALTAFGCVVVVIVVVRMFATGSGSA